MKKVAFMPWSASTVRAANWSAVPSSNPIVTTAIGVVSVWALLADALEAGRAHAMTPAARAKAPAIALRRLPLVPMAASLDPSDEPSPRVDGVLRPFGETSGPRTVVLRPILRQHVWHERKEVVRLHIEHETLEVTGC